MIKHGTINRYNNYKCRCDLCRDAWSVYMLPKVTKWRRDNGVRDRKELIKDGLLFKKRLDG